MSGNRELLRSAVENVLRNAVRYSPQGAPVEVAVERSAAGLTISVRELGPGVPGGELERICEPFYRVAESRDRDSGGEGIGLAITSQVMKAHGGGAKAVNAQGGGFEVRLSLPATVFAADDRSYIDYVGSWGPMILGHAHPQVIQAVQDVAALGLSFGAPTTRETELARRVVALMPSIELVRFVSSGTEATMSAIRLARGFTGRDTIVKFEGCYHGHSDSLLIKAGSGTLTFGVPTSPGVPKALAAHTVTLDYNDSDQVRDAFRQIGAEIACVIVEPVAGNMNCVPPAPGFLETLREVCDGSGALLVFDEVMTGFRVALGGAQELYGIRPDLTTLGKIIGGGMPVGAFGGRREIMEQLAPLGPVYQAGTLSGNPLAMAAGIATVGYLHAHRAEVYAQLESLSEAVAHGVAAEAAKVGVPLVTNRVG